MSKKGREILDQVDKLIALGRTAIALRPDQFNTLLANRHDLTKGGNKPKTINYRGATLYLYEETK